MIENVSAAVLKGEKLFKVEIYWLFYVSISEKPTGVMSFPTVRSWPKGGAAADTAAEINHAVNRNYLVLLT